MQHDPNARKTLVALLNQAAQLEHSLLDAYLYTACSLKTMPQEFATVSGKPNRRRAVQFERVREWKQKILMVAHEEMRHLHLVQCLLRALGEPANFTLPKRDPTSNDWIIPGWKAEISGKAVDDGGGVQIPLDFLTSKNIKRFVMFESTDALQDDNPFGERAMALFASLYDFEIEFRLESMLYGVQDDAQRAELKEKLRKIYTELTPLEKQKAPPKLGLPPLDKIEFQSIADLYNLGILPLYRQAFDAGWVANTNRNLINELLDPNIAAEGFLPVGPMYRDMNFQKRAKQVDRNPLQDYKNVDDIVKEIVEEGEGNTNFEGLAEQFLAKIAELGGARPYLSAWLADQASQGAKPTPPWLIDGQNLRQSHLYRFVMIMMGLKQEVELSAHSGLKFAPSREPINVKASVRLQKLTNEAPGRFNACYLVMLMWLQRMYATQLFEADKDRRHAIEMLASWPIMATAIRPFLELVSFLPVDRKQLFRTDAAGLPLLPLHAQQLFALYDAPERSAAINAEMDTLGLRVLTDVATWAAAHVDAVANADLPDDTKAMMLVRLKSLAQLDEFEKQFPFRVAGGYSNQMPDLTYQQSQPHADKYEENPGFQGQPVFQKSLALRLRFSGWGLVQMSTDPDHPADESGCTGTLMLHPADGTRGFDRYLYWQPTPGRTILRAPREKLPAIGVNCTEVALVVASDGGVYAGYEPLSIMSSAGAVQTQGVQQLPVVKGFADLLKLTPAEILGEDRQIRVDLLAKGDIGPFLTGYNHLISKDGEPIDPFVLAVLADGAAGADAALLFQREVFNEGKSFLEMSPLQRLESSRWATGFDSISNIPDWALGNMSEGEQQLLQSKGFPRSYLAARAGVLAQSLAQEIAGTPVYDQQLVDSAVSMAERMALISVPRNTTTKWLMYMLHHGHTVSGDLSLGTGENPILSAVRQRTGLELDMAHGTDRHKPNGRWLVSYTSGMMDTDALSDYIYGELYVPVTVNSNGERFEFRWTFPPSMQAAVQEYALNFAAPFWADFHVQGNVRTVHLPDGKLLTETLEAATADSYQYGAEGFPGVTEYHGSFSLTATEETVELVWKCRWTASDPQAIVYVLSTIAGGAQAMTEKMKAHFGPVSH